MPLDHVPTMKSPGSFASRRALQSLRRLPRRDVACVSRTSKPEDRRRRNIQRQPMGETNLASVARKAHYGTSALRLKAICAVCCASSIFSSLNRLGPTAARWRLPVSTPNRCRPRTRYGWRGEAKPSDLGGPAASLSKPCYTKSENPSDCVLLTTASLLRM